MRIQELYENELEKLKRHKQSLDDKESKQVSQANLESSIWKSKDPKTDKVTYVASTHRAYATASTLKGAISKAKKNIDSTG